MNRFSLLLSCVILALIPSGSAWAQTTLSSQTKTTVRLSEQQLDEVRRYVEYWCAELTAGDPTKVKRARDQLIDPFVTRTGTAVSDSFRLQYSRAAQDLLRGAVEDAANPHGTINGLIVLSFIGTDDDMETVSAFLSIEDESRDFVRMIAARSATKILSDGHVSQDKVNSYIRTLQRAADVEEVHYVLSHHIACMLATENAAGRNAAVRTLDKLVPRLADGAPSPMINAYTKALTELRNLHISLIATSTAEANAFEQVLGPMLKKAVPVLESHPDYQTALEMTNRTLRDIEG